MSIFRKFHRILFLPQIICLLLVALTACGSGDTSATDNSNTDTSGSSQIDTAPALANYLIEPKYRLADSEDKTWLPVDGNNVPEVTPNTVIEIQTQYINLDPVAHQNLTFWVELPQGISLVPGSTIVYNTDFPDGLEVDNDELFDNGIIIGDYAGYDPEDPEVKTLETGEKCGINAYVRFRVVADELEPLEGEETPVTVRNCTIAITASAQRADSDTAMPARELVFIRVTETPGETTVDTNDNTDDGDTSDQRGNGLAFMP